MIAQRLRILPGWYLDRSPPACEPATNQTLCYCVYLHLSPLALHLFATTETIRKTNR